MPSNTRNKSIADKSISDIPICVVGAGVSGLASALRLLKTGFKNVTVVSYEFSPKTTSDVAGAILRPGYLGETPEGKILKWADETIKWASFLYSKTILNPGVTLLGGYEICKEVPFWKDIVLGFRPLGQTEKGDLPEGSEGFYYTTFLFECKKYLVYLMGEIKRHGGIIRQKRVRSVNDLTGFSIVVNCTNGLQQRIKNAYPNETFMPDPNVIGVRGQTVLVKAPFVKCHYNEMSDPRHPMYIYPRQETVLLGGTYHPNDTSYEENEVHTQLIIERAAQYIPALTNAEVLEVKVGLRPLRKKGVRLEREIVKRDDGKDVLVVHNYGHGGAGVAVHWGCAGDVVELIVKHLKAEPKERTWSGLAGSGLIKSSL